MANFKALDLSSQGASGEVLYFDQDVAPRVLFECIHSRLNAVERLHNELLYPVNDEIKNSPISEVTAILLSDVKGMFWAMHNHTVTLENNQKEIIEHKNKITELNETINQLKATTSTEGTK